MTYTGWLSLLALAAVIVCLTDARDWGDRSGRLWRLLAVAAGALILGRLGFLFLNASYFVERPAAVVAASGFSEQAAWVGGWLGWRLTAGHAAGGRLVRPDRIAVAGLLVAAGASLGCGQAACAYGREVYPGAGLGWALRVDWPDAFGIANPRLPAQLLLAVWLGAGALAGLLVQRSRRQVDIMALATLWFGIGDTVDQVLRADGAPMWAGVRAYLWLDGILILSALAALALRARTQPTST